MSAVLPTSFADLLTQYGGIAANLARRWWRRFRRWVDFPEMLNVAWTGLWKGAASFPRVSDPQRTPHRWLASCTHHEIVNYLRDLGLLRGRRFVAARFSLGSEDSPEPTDFRLRRPPEIAAQRELSAAVARLLTQAQYNQLMLRLDYGLHWDEIGRLSGVSKQAAQQSFSRLIDHCAKSLAAD